MADREHAIQDAIRRAVPPTRAVLWHNSTGQVEIPRADGGITHLRYGLAVGSADLVGVRRPDGRFVALEVKSATGRPTPDQLQWLDLVRRCGGIAAVVRSVDEALEVIG